MTTYSFTGELKYFIDRAETGAAVDVDFLMDKLINEPTLAITKYIDFALGCVTNEEGVDRIKYYLFNGKLIQRNYASLYFNRRGDWKIVKEAWGKGLIDYIQAFAR